MRYTSALAFAAAGIATVSAFEYPEFVPLHRRQEPGTPQYDCHANCGGVITESRTDGFCSSSVFQGHYSACMACALTYDIWQYYSASVTSAGNTCGLNTTPNPPAPPPPASSSAAPPPPPPPASSSSSDAPPPPPPPTSSSAAPPPTGSTSSAGPAPTSGATTATGSGTGTQTGSPTAHTPAVYTGGANVVLAEDMFWSLGAGVLAAAALL